MQNGAVRQGRVKKKYSSEVGSKWMMVVAMVAKTKGKRSGTTAK